MQAEARRKAILDILQYSTQAISATALAGRFSVSRQVIVGDIALLRASGTKISATPRGYILLEEETGLIRQLVCQHSAEEMKKELYVMVDHGCTVLDVIVEHPIYGQLTGPLQLKSRYDVDQFIRRCNASEARPLSHLTDGIHLHSLSCPDEASFLRVKEALSSMGILFID